MQLESTYVKHVRYMVLITREGFQGIDESAILGIDIRKKKVRDEESKCKACGRYCNTEDMEKTETGKNQSSQT